MKYRKILFIFLISISIFFRIDVKALEIAESNPTITEGNFKDIELYVNTPSDTKEINFSLTFLSYDVIGTFESTTGILTNNGTSLSISFNEPISGRIKLGIVKIKTSKNISINKSKVNLHNANAVLVDGTTKKLNNQSIQVNITKEKIAEANTNLLKSISSNIVNIILEPDKYEYEIFVKNEVDKLDLTATAIDETYKIDITDQNLNKGKNQIFITVSKENISEKYTINVTKEEKEEIPPHKTEEKNHNISKNQTKNFKSGWNSIIIGLITVLIIGISMMIKK